MITSYATLLVGTFLTSYLTAKFISRIRYQRLLVPDVHKLERPLIPKIGGVAVITSSIYALTCSYILNIIDTKLMLLLLFSIFSGCLGLIDDLIEVEPLIRVFLTVMPGIVITYLGVVSQLTIPPIGTLRNMLLINTITLLTLPIYSNAVNMLEVVNGVVPASVCIIMLTMTLTSIIVGKYVNIIPSLLVLSISLGVYLLNRYPARIFNGSSGTYALGTLLGTYMILYDMCVPLLIASLPYIINGLLIITSSRGFKTRHKLRRPTVVNYGDGRIVVNPDPEAPTTLMRLIVLSGSKTEKEIVNSIIILFTISSTLSILTYLVLINS